MNTEVKPETFKGIIAHMASLRRPISEILECVKAYYPSYFIKHFECGSQFSGFLENRIYIGDKYLITITDTPYTSMQLEMYEYNSKVIEKNSIFVFENVIDIGGRHESLLVKMDTNTYQFQPKTIGIFEFLFTTFSDKKVAYDIKVYP